MGSSGHQGASWRRPPPPLKAGDLLQVGIDYRKFLVERREEPPKPVIDGSDRSARVGVHGEGREHPRHAAKIVTVSTDGEELISPELVGGLKLGEQLIDVTGKHPALVARTRHEVRSTGIRQLNPPRSEGGADRVCTGEELFE